MDKCATKLVRTDPRTTLTCAAFVGLDQVARDLSNDPVALYADSLPGKSSKTSTVRTGGKAGGGREGTGGVVGKGQLPSGTKAPHGGSFRCGTQDSTRRSQLCVECALPVALLSLDGVVGVRCRGGDSDGGCGELQHTGARRLRWTRNKKEWRQKRKEERVFEVLSVVSFIFSATASERM